jgi:hypothetical protein
MNYWYMIPENVCPLCKKPPTLRRFNNSFLYYACRRIGHPLGRLMTTEEDASKVWRDLVNEKSF